MRDLSRLARWLTLIAGAASLLLAAGCRQAAQDTETPPHPCGPITEVSTELPDLVFTSVEGESLRLSDFRGSTVVLDFWAMMCKGCVDGLDEYEADGELSGDPQVQLLALSSDRSVEAVREFARQKGWSFPVALITPEAREALFGTQPMVVPQVRILDAEGRLRFALGPRETNLETVKCLVRYLEGA